ncbi:MAG: hypothetical protein OK457_09360, partial [Thaumarchaeota archaeon]|nr:hypothetical protein [Nitrososphaerota archaeon]
MKIKSRAGQNKKSKLIITLGIGLLLLAGTFSSPLYSSVDHVESYDLDAAQDIPVPPSAFFVPFAGANPSAWARAFESNRSVSPDYGKLELLCQISGVNFSSTCASRMRQVRLAFVNPIFTTSAYQPNGFYAFYKLHGNSSQAFITRDLSLLNVSVIDGWGVGSGLLSFIQTYETKGYLRTDTPVLTDVDIHNGAL